MLRSSVVSGEQFRVLVRTYRSSGAPLAEPLAEPALSFLALRSGEGYRQSLIENARAAPERRGPEVSGGRDREATDRGTTHFATVTLDLPKGIYALSALGDASAGSGPVVTVFAADP